MSATSTHSDARDPLEEAFRRLLAIMNGEDEDDYQVEPEIYVSSIS